MIVQVKDLLPNPYRRIGKYPIDAAKVEALKVSIEQTEFWDNILARASGEGYQIAYGHHRLEAIKQLGIKQVDIPVKDLDDATMLRIMANENMDEWKASPSVINETVAAAKEFIDAELAKYETWDAYLAAKNSIQIPDAHAFANLKRQGAGRSLICAFLGGNWKAWMVEASLRTLNDTEVDREAVETFKSTESARAFQAAAKTYKIPKEEQKAVAQEIVKSGNDSKRDVKKAVQQVVKERVKEKAEPYWEPPQEDVDLKRLEGAIVKAAKECVDTAVAIQSVLDEMDILEVSELSGVETLGLRNKAILLVDAVSRLAPYIGFEITRSDIDG